MAKVNKNNGLPDRQYGYAPKVSSKGRITDKMASFVSEYVIDKNAARAAVAAGYSPKGAEVAAFKLMRNPAVRELIAAKLKAQEKRASLTADQVLEYIHLIMTFNPLRFFEPGDNGGWLADKKKWDKLPDYIGQLIESIEERSIELPNGSTITKIWVKLIPKATALALAAKHQLDPLREMALDNKEGAVPVEVVDWSPMQAPGNVPDEVEARIVEVESSVITQGQPKAGASYAKLEDKTS